MGVNIVEEIKVGDMVVPAEGKINLWPSDYNGKPCEVIQVKDSGMLTVDVSTVSTGGWDDEAIGKSKYWGLRKDECIVVAVHTLVPEKEVPIVKISHEFKTEVTADSTKPPVPVEYEPGFNTEGLRAIHEEGLQLGIKKNRDYAGCIDTIGTTGVQGLAVRMFDKAARLLSLTQAGAVPQNESLRDTFIDMMNYASYGAMLLDKTWNRRRKK